jgi:TolB-like protein
LAEFPSAVEAVRAATQFQTRIFELTVGETEDNRIALRVGINIGDVIVEPHDIFGDDVNIAARLESIADPGGICISSSAYEHVRGKVGVEFADLGEQRLKNIDRPVRAHAAKSRGDLGMAGPSMSPSHLEAQKPLSLPDKPSIAVLPFQNISGDPEQDYFADGMAQDIITALSRFKSLVVIARNSSFAYKGKTVDIKTVGRELGVRYVLEGSVRKAGGRMRISGELIEAATNHHLWANKFDGELGDVFELQDRVTEQVAAAVGTRLYSEQALLSQRKPTEKLDAYDYLLRANAAWRPGDREANDTALRLAYRAIELDPEYGRAYAAAASFFNVKKQARWMRDRQQETAEALRLARLAIAFAKDDAVALAVAGMAFGYLGGELDAGVSLVDQAIELNPNYMGAWSISGWLRLYLGHHELAIEHQNRAMRLSPRDFNRPDMLAMAGFANLFLGRFDTAERLANEAVQLSINHLPSLRVLTCSLAFQGKLDQSGSAARRVLSLDPTFRLPAVRELIPLRRPEDLSRYVEGLRLAGIPE